MSLDLFRLTDRVAIVTGAGRAIGRSIALTLAGAGADIVVAELDDATGTTVAQDVRDLGRRALAVKTDATSAESIQSMVDRVVAELGRIDILVNGVGGQLRESGNPLGWVQGEETFDREIALNLKSAFLCSRAVIPVMQKQGQGAIVHISSGGAIIGVKSSLAYSAAKAGLVQMAKSQAVQLAPVIRVNAVAPASIDTPGFPKPGEVGDRIAASVPMKSLGDPKYIAAAVLYLASDAAGYVTGHTLVVDGGMTID